MKKYRHSSLDGRFLNLFWIVIVITSLSAKIVFCAEHILLRTMIMILQMVTRNRGVCFQWCSHLKCYGDALGSLLSKMSGISAASKTDAQKVTTLLLGPMTCPAWARTWIRVLCLDLHIHHILINTKKTLKWATVGEIFLACHCDSKCLNTSVF